MIRLRHAVLILACMVIPTAALGGQKIDPDNPPHGRFADDWMEVLMMGQKVGYAHSTMAREGDLIHTATTMYMRMGRVATPVEIRSTQRTTETLAGRPVSFASELKAATMNMGTRGTIKDGTVTVVSSQFGIDQTRTLPFTEGGLMTWGAFRESLRHGFETGTTYTLAVYTPDLRLDAPVDAITTIGEVETFEHRGITRSGREVTMVMDTPAGKLEAHSWVDENGTPIRTKLPMPGLGDVVMIEADEATALADFVPPEIFTTTTIQATQPIDTKAARQIKYRVSAKHAGIDLGEMPQTGMQQATKLDDGSFEVVVTRLRQSAKGASPSGTAQDTMAEYLGGNLMINTEDPELVKLAKRAGGELANRKSPDRKSADRKSADRKSADRKSAERKPANRKSADRYALADRLRRFVTEYISEKNLTVGFATASEVCRTREGDCSEHAVLLAAMGRLNGLPSRVVTGLAYVPVFGRQQNIFGYHMWTQFFIDGQWVDVDAALRETQCSPARIVFAVSSLKNTGLADLSLPLINKIGAIDVRILEINGQPVKTP